MHASKNEKIIRGQVESISFDSQFNSSADSLNEKGKSWII